MNEAYFAMRMLADEENRKKMRKRYQYEVYPIC